MQGWDMCMCWKDRKLRSLQMIRCCSAPSDHDLQHALGQGCNRVWKGWDERRYLHVWGYRSPQESSGLRLLGWEWATAPSYGVQVTLTLFFNSVSYYCTGFIVMHHPPHEIQQQKNTSSSDSRVRVKEWCTGSESRVWYDKNIISQATNMSFLLTVAGKYYIFIAQLLSEEMSRFHSLHVYY